MENENLDKSKTNIKDSEEIKPLKPIKNIDGYSLEETAKILNRSVATIKRYLELPNEYGLKLIDNELIDKASVENLVQRRKESGEKWSNTDIYRRYCKETFSNLKTPVTFEEYFTKGFVKGNEKLIDLNLYMSFDDVVSYLNLATFTVRAYINQQKKFRCLIDGFDDYVLKEDVIKYGSRTEICIKYSHCKKKLPYTHFKDKSITICNSCERKIENEKLEERKMEEMEYQKTIKKYNSLYVGGYFICQNAFIKEDFVSHLIPLHGQIRVISTDSLNQPSFLADENGNIVTFKNHAICRGVLINLLKEKELRMNNKNK